MKILKEILLWVWQLPQNLLALLLLLFYKIFYRDVQVYDKLNGRTFYCTSGMPSGVSLGNYIIMKGRYYYAAYRHEYGHSRQSRYLGPLYLLLIGLPSLTGNIYDRLFHKNWSYNDRLKWYYNQPWEEWADKLGSVKREF